ncbi:nuclear receptor-binding protein-like isoform X2 [Dysidea avara]|uniref:nuclear receptor-binding protein-like isoform X2 n=1 Tax=Dysidea avara TaxID=196820 RepID=UPI00331E60BB
MNGVGGDSTVYCDVPVAKATNETDEGDDPEDDEDEVVETKGQWRKMAEPVSQRDVPGIDAAFLAVDVEEGTEVVWNEVSVSKSKAKRDKEQLLKTLEQLTGVKHANIVKFYEFWYEPRESANTAPDRLVFITEYMTSGTLLQFLKKSKKNNKQISDKTWRRWCQQILAALCYLHELDIIHGNLTLDTIFIQHNGLVKIGSISPQNINKHVKTSVDSMSGRIHYIAPESGELVATITMVMRLFASYHIVVKMLCLELLGNGEHRTKVQVDEIDKALTNLNGPQKDFISMCLTQEASERPTAKQLLKSPILQEVYSLMLYAAQVWRNHNNKTLESLPGSSDDAVNRHSYPSSNELGDPQKVVAESYDLKGEKLNVIRAGEVQQVDLEKYIEEHQVDILYQDIISTLDKKHDNDSSQQPVQQLDDTQQPQFDPEIRPEIRRVTGGECEIKVEGNRKQIMIKLHFDKLERSVTSPLENNDTAAVLTESLVSCGLLNLGDHEKVVNWIEQKLRKDGYKEILT